MHRHRDDTDLVAVRSLSAALQVAPGAVDRYTESAESNKGTPSADEARSDVSRPHGGL